MGKIDYEALEWLVNTPVGDVNFTTQLKQAGAETVRKAIEQVQDKPGNKTKLKALTCRLRQELEDLEAANSRQDRTVAMDVETLRAEREIEQARQTEQTEREQLIAKTHQMIGQIRAADMFGKFANVSSLVWLQQVKESKIYKDLPNVGTWEKFCNSIGLSRQKVDLDLQNLATFGEEFLLTVSSLSVGYRELRKLRQLSHDGVVRIEDDAITIGDETIPIDPDHADDLHAAIEKIIEQNTALGARVERLEKQKDEVVKEETKGLKAEVSALVKEVGRLKAFDPEDKDRSWAAEQIKEIHDAVASLSVLCGKVMIDERALDDPVILGQVEGYVAGAETILRQLRQQWEDNVHLFEE